MNDDMKTKTKRRICLWITFVALATAWFFIVGMIDGACSLTVGIPVSFVGLAVGLLAAHKGGWL